MTGSGARFTTTSQAAAMPMEIAHETSCGATSSSHSACAGLNRIAVIVATPVRSVSDKASSKTGAVGREKSRTMGGERGGCRNG